jgi:hypothetical protein
VQFHTAQYKINIYCHAHEIITRNGDHKSWALIDSCVWENSQYMCGRSAARRHCTSAAHCQPPRRKRRATQNAKRKVPRLLCSLTHLLQISISRLSITYSRRSFLANLMDRPYQVQLEINSTHWKRPKIIIETCSGVVSDTYRLFLIYRLHVSQQIMSSKRAK